MREGCMGPLQGWGLQKSFPAVLLSCIAPLVLLLTPHCSLLCPAGLRASLQRLQLEYVDVVFANRPDNNTPMEGQWQL